MCGIIGYIGGDNAVPILIEGLKRLEYRGYDSAGIAVIHDAQLAIRKAVGKLKNLEEVVGNDPPTGTIGIGHTRWATHGRVTELNAHPHEAAGFVLVHNGIIENYLALKEKLSAEGHEFRTETDTEVIVHLIAKHFTGDLTAAVHHGLAGGGGGLCHRGLEYGRPQYRRRGAFRLPPGGGSWPGGVFPGLGCAGGAEPHAGGHLPGRWRGGHLDA